MKKIVWLVVLVSLAAIATAFVLIHHRAVSHSKVKELEPLTGVPKADWKDAILWRKAGEYRAVENELKLIGREADAWDNLTSNQVDVLIYYMHSPHYEAREMAVILAGGKYPDPVRAVLVPHVLGLLSDQVEGVRFWAASSLGRMGDKKMIPFLQPLLKDARPGVARCAQRAILRLQEGKETVTGK